VFTVVLLKEAHISFFPTREHLPIQKPYHRTSSVLMNDYLLLNDIHYGVVRTSALVFCCWADLLAYGIVFPLFIFRVIILHSVNSLVRAHLTLKISYISFLTILLWQRPEIRGIYLARWPSQRLSCVVLTVFLWLPCDSWPYPDDHSAGPCASA